MNKRFTWLLMLCLWCIPSLGMAQSVGDSFRNVCLFPVRGFSASKDACVFDSGCSAEQRCRSGYCQLKPGVYREQVLGEKSAEEQPDLTKFPELAAPATPVADEECQQDRRCRINRLRRQNNARRYVATVSAEERALQYQRKHQERLVSDIYRRVSPINVELFGSFLGAGLTGGYTVNGWLRLEGGFQYFYEYIDAEIPEFGGAYFSTDLDAFFYHLQGTYLFRESWWSPYLSAGFIYGSGDFGYGFDGFGGGSSLNMTMHLLSASAGLDLQTSFGLRGRLGAVTRQPIYTRVATSPGVYDDLYKSGVEAYFKNEQRISFELSAGWAF